MHKKLFFFVLLTILAVTVQANLLCNPGFEDNDGFGGGSADYWTNTGAAGIESWSNHTGSWGMPLVTWRNSGNGEFYQDVAVTENINCVYLIWACRDGGTPNPGSYTMKIKWYAGATLLGEISQDITDDVFPESVAWTEISLNGTSPAGCNTARIMLIGTSVNVVGKFDDASFAPVIIANNPNPSDNADVEPDTDLSWSAGAYAASHDVYFGTDFNDVNEASPTFMVSDISNDGQVDWNDILIFANQWLTIPSGSPSADIAGDSSVNLLDFAVMANDWMENSAFKGSQTETSFEPGVMDVDTVYYWRIDEVNGVDIWKGDVWSFTVSYDYEIRITASSSEDESLVPENALDLNMETCWGSEHSDIQWLEIDLRQVREVYALTIFWEDAYALSYDVLTSLDGQNWQTVFSQNSGQGGYEGVEFETVEARYIRLAFSERATEWGYSIYEIAIDGIDLYGTCDIGEFGLLEGKWKFRLDPSNTGVQSGWLSEDSNGANWSAEIELGKSWEEQGYSGYDDYAWYKKDIFIPAGWADSNAAIVLGGVDDAYELYINGQYVATFGTMTSESNSVAHTLTYSLISNYVTHGELNDFTFRVFDFWGYGGIIGTPSMLVQNGEQQSIDFIQNRLDVQSYYQIKATPSQSKYFPNWVGGYQAYWTVVGVEADAAESTFCEDGMIQMYNRGPSLMPFIHLDDVNELLSYADFELTQSLENEYIPVPTVKWENDDLIFSQKLFANGTVDKSLSCVHYILENKSGAVLNGKLFLTIRPFHVNPSWQWGGGMAKINSMEYDENTKRVKIDGWDQLIALEVSDSFGALGYLAGDIVNEIKTGSLTSALSVDDPFGYASGALEYDFELGIGEQKEYFFVIPLCDDANTISSISTPEDFNDKHNETVNLWESKLNQVQIDIPNNEMLNTIKSSLAYILINRDGPMLQAGSGAYEKSWIRDACITSAALLRMGHTQEVRAYIDWISDYVKANGKVPPIMVAEDTIDPAWESVYEEYDSQGQYIYAVLQYYFFTKDEAFLAEKLPTVILVLDFMEALRAERLTPEYENGEFYGIFPESVSHEGYFPPPGVHSYWDDFWGLKGWVDARTIAEVLQRDDLFAWIDGETADFRQCVYDSITLVQSLKSIDFIPGCAERGDFDAPSTAIAVWPTEESQYLPQTSLLNTFETFWDDQFAPTLEDDPWSYASYALRISHVFVRLNQRDRAKIMLEHYLKLRRPLAWNQWAEGTLADDRKPWFIGDLPHSWVASIYMNSFRSLFVYEEDDKLILGHGVDGDWLDEGVSIGNMPTCYGDISYDIIRVGDIVTMNVSGAANPNDGFVFKPPFSESEIISVTIDGNEIVGFSGNEIPFDTLPVSISIDVLTFANTDIGSVQTAGSLEIDGDEYTVKASGDDLWGQWDQGHIAYCRLQGDCEVIARVVSVDYTNEWAKAGVTIRESLDSNSRNATMLMTPTNRASFQWRLQTTGSTCASTEFGLSLPYWIRLVRTGNTFTAYRSSNGISWTQQGNAQTISMGEDVYVGLIVTSHNDGTLCTAVFDNIHIQ